MGFSFKKLFHVRIKVTVKPKQKKTVKQVLAVGLALAAPFAGGAAPLLLAGSQLLAKPKQPKPVLPPSTAIRSTQPMAFDIGQFIGNVGGILSKSPGLAANPYAAGLGSAFSVASAFIPQKKAAMTTVARRLPVTPIRPGGNVSVLPRAVSGLTQEIFNAGTKVLGRLGIPFKATAGSFSAALRRSLGSIASLARRTPAGTIVSILAGLGLTAIEANMLAAWFAQRKKGRRMNPANSRALRRAARRIRGFHKLCTHTDVLKTRGRSRSVGRCGSCRKSPCSC